MSRPQISFLRGTIICISFLFGFHSANAQIFDFFGFPFSELEQQQNRPSVQVQQRPTSSLYYNLTFENYFGNREYDAGDELFTQSQTLKSARITPQIGIQIDQNQRMQHRVVLGIDIMKNMGESPTSSSEKSLQNWDLFREMTMFYNLNARVGKTRFESYVGSFPRRYSGGEWSKAFISDSLKFYDNNLEGFLIKISRPRFYFETSLDWNGKYSYNRRESFVAAIEAKTLISKHFEAGIDISYHHLAGSELVKGVIDNGLAEPFIKYDFTDLVPLNRLTAKLGYYQAFQNDRVRFHKYIFPAAGELTLDIMNWNVGIENNLYYGTNLMPYYNDKDVLGHTLGSTLYYGSPLYQNRVNSYWQKKAFYDRVEVYYRPHISSFIDLNLSVVLDFNGEYSGSRQKFSVFFDLERLYSKASSGRSPYNTTSSSNRRKKAERPTPPGLQSL